MDPEAVLDVHGRPVIVRIHEGSREPPARIDGDFQSALSSAIDGMYRKVIVEARGLRQRGDEARASALSSAISSASVALGCEKPLCIPPSSASGTMTCSFKAYFSDFSDFASRFLQEVERELIHGSGSGSRSRGGAFGLFRRGGH
ncbi:MAG: hypothetical protein ACPL2E_06930 [Conexivisphaera sp.]|jgi:hypothetical protein